MFRLSTQHNVHKELSVIPSKKDTKLSSYLYVHSITHMAILSDKKAIQKRLCTPIWLARACDIHDDFRRSWSWIRYVGIPQIKDYWSVPTHYETLSMTHLRSLIYFMGDITWRVVHQALLDMAGEQATTPKDVFFYHKTQAEVFMNEGRLDESEQHLSRAQQIAQEVEDMEVVELIKLQNSLAVLSFRNQKLALAAQLFLQCIDNSKAHGLSTIAYQNNHAFVLMNDGKSREAEHSFRTLLKEQLETYDPNHHHVLQTKCNIGMALYHQEKYEDAVIWYEELLMQSRVALGNDHPITSDIQNNYSSTIAVLGQHERAYELHKGIYKQSCEMLGIHHPNTLISLFNMACESESMEQWTQALHEYQQCAEQRIVRLGEAHPDTFEVHRRWGRCLHDMGNLEESIKVRKKAVECLYAQEQPNLADIIPLWWRIGDGHRILEQWTQALQAFYQAVGAAEQAYGLDDMEAICLNQECIDCLFELGQLQQAKEVYKSTIDRIRTVVGNNSEQEQDIRMRFARLLGEDL